MGKGEVELLKNKLQMMARCIFIAADEVVAKDISAGLHAAMDTIDTLAAEVESLKTDAERYRKVRRDPAMLLHLRNTEFDSAIDALPPEPQEVGGETLCPECGQPPGQVVGRYCVSCGRVQNV